MDLDLTLIAQLTIFVSILVALNGLLFKPFLRTIEARHQKIHGLRAEAHRLERQSLDEQKLYEERLRQARGEALKRREGYVREGRDQERQLVAEARAEVTQVLQQARERVAQEASAAQHALQADTQVIAHQLVEKILGRPLST